MRAKEFARDAAMGGMLEVCLAKLAQQKSSNADVDRLAQRIERDHERANQKLQRIAQNLGIDLPSTNTFAKYMGKQAGERRQETASSSTSRTQRERANATTGREEVRGAAEGAIPLQDVRDLEKLQGLSGTEFDRAYVKDMVEDHRKDIEKFDQAAKNLDQPELKNFAQENLPVLREHYQMAQRAAATLGIQTDTSPVEETNQK